MMGGNHRETRNVPWARQAISNISEQKSSPPQVLSLPEGNTHNKTNKKEDNEMRHLPSREELAGNTTPHLRVLGDAVQHVQ